MTLFNKKKTVRTEKIIVEEKELVIIKSKTVERRIPIREKPGFVSTKKEVKAEKPESATIVVNRKDITFGKKKDGWSQTESIFFKMFVCN